MDLYISGLLTRVLWVAVLVGGWGWAQEAGGEGSNHSQLTLKHHNYPSRGTESNLTKLEHRLGHRIREVEHRLSKQIEHKSRLLNHTLSVNYLEIMYHSLAEDFDLYRGEFKQEKAALHTKINTMDRQLVTQQEEIRRMRETVETLQRTVGKLNDVKPIGGTDVITPGTSVQPSHDASDGPTKTELPQDCEELYRHSSYKLPEYYYGLVQPRQVAKPFSATCRTFNNTGWTVIQRRTDGSVDFYRTWAEYRDGFGSASGELWLGNDRIHALTRQGDYKLRVEMEDWTGKASWAEYEHFRIDNEANQYRLHVHDYRGTAGDSLTSYWGNHNNQPFSTHDRDNDDRYYDNCAKHYHGAWWFKACFESHLNGVYYHQAEHKNFFVRNGIQWNSVHLHSSLKMAAMMIAPNAEFSEINDTESNGID